MDPPQGDQRRKPKREPGSGPSYVASWQVKAPSTTPQNGDLGNKRISPRKAVALPSINLPIGRRILPKPAMSTRFSRGMSTANPANLEASSFLPVAGNEEEVSMNSTLGVKDYVFKTPPDGTLYKIVVPSGVRLSVAPVTRSASSLPFSASITTSAMESDDPEPEESVKTEEIPPQECEAPATPRPSLMIPSQSTSPSRVSLRPRQPGKTFDRFLSESKAERLRSKSLTNVEQFDGVDAGAPKSAKKPKNPIAEKDSRFQTFEVEKIIRKKGTKSRARYLVKWLGFDDLTWEPEKHFPKTNEALRAFKRELVKKTQAKKLSLWDKGAESKEPDIVQPPLPDDEAVVREDEEMGDEVIAEHHGIPPALGEYSSQNLMNLNAAEPAIVPCIRRKPRGGLSRVFKQRKPLRRSPEILLKRGGRLPTTSTLTSSQNSDSRPGWAKRTGVPVVNREKERPGKVSSVSVQLHPRPETPIDAGTSNHCDHGSIVPVAFEMDHTYCSPLPVIQTTADNSTDSPDNKGPTTVPAEKPSSPELPEVPPVYHGRIRLLNEPTYTNESAKASTLPTAAPSETKTSLPVINDKSSDVDAVLNGWTDETCSTSQRPPTESTVHANVASVKPHSPAVLNGPIPLGKPKPAPFLRDRPRPSTSGLAKSKRGPSSPESGASVRLTKDASTNTRTEWAHARELIRVADTGRSGLQTEALVVNISGFKPRQLAVSSLDDICFLVTYADREPEFVDYQECIRKIPHMVAEFLFHNTIHCSQPARWSGR